jgi:hypothetical protein
MPVRVHTDLRLGIVIMNSFRDLIKQEKMLK